MPEREEDKGWVYLGDGVYAKSDGYGIWLHANDHLNPTDRIYLEDFVYTNLVNSVKRLKKE